MSHKMSQNDYLIPLSPTEEHRVVSSRGLTFPVRFVRAEGCVIHYVNERGVPGSCHAAEFLRVTKHG